MKHPVEVTIMGQKFQVRSEADDDYVFEVAKFVNQKVDEVIGSTKSVASVKVAILAAMNIADEFFKFQRTKKVKFKELEKKIEDMIELVDLQL